MENYKISVIIPFYNSEKTILKCLNSILSQDYKNYEIILVNNNSTDKTKLIIEEFVKNNNRIKYFFEPKIGRGTARNFGILQSTGDIIAMLDADCIAFDNWLTNLTKPIIRENEIAVMGGDQDLIGSYWTKNIQKSNFAFIQKNIFGKYIRALDTKNFAIKSEVIKKIMFDENLKAFEDFDLYLRLAGQCQIRFLSDIKVGHYHKNSFVGNISLNISRGYWNAKIYRKYRKNKNLISHLMFESVSIINFIKLPFWLIWQIAKRPKDALFIVTSEISWRIGILGGLMR